MRIDDFAAEVKLHPRKEMMMDKGLILRTIPFITIDITDSKTARIKAAGKNERIAVNIRGIQIRKMCDETLRRRASKTKHK
jgi:hypothetical protein